MNREIKFRVWHTIRKEMFRVDGLKWIVGKLYCFENDENKAMPMEEMKYGELMQFTGLKDKNGKDIYEGDICERKSGQTFVGEIIFKGARFCMRNPSGHPQREWQIYGNLGNWEVIGNIYENPELLK